MDTITNMKTFVAVAECGSFVGAARQLQVAASIVTKRVEQLEWRTGQKLFERSTRRVALTEAGQRLLPEAQRIAQDVDDVLSRIRAAVPLAGRLRVKVPTHFTAFWLAELLARFQRAHPSIMMEIVALDRAVDPVQEGFDVALGMFAASFADVIAIDLCAVPRMLAASPQYLASHPPLQHPTQLLRHDILNFQPLGTTWRFAGASGPIDVAVTPRLNSNDGQALLHSALESNGVTLLTTYLLMPAVNAGLLQPVLENYTVADLWMRALVPEARRSNPGVSALVDFLVTEFAGGLPGAFAPLGSRAFRAAS